MKKYTADFETTTRADDCRVWAYAICEVGNPDNFIYGNSIDDFIDWCANPKSNDTVYFHNLKFDSQFIMNWLFKNGYVHTTQPEQKATKTFNTLISDKGLFYQVEVIFKKKGLF